MRTRLFCKCGAAIIASKEQANKSIQCTSCLNRILIPPEAILASLGALNRGKRLRITWLFIMGLLVIAALAAGIYAHSKTDHLLRELPATIRDQIDSTDRYLAKVRTEVRNKGGAPDEDARVRDLCDLLAALEAQPQEEENAAQVEIEEVVQALDGAGPEHQTDMTKAWLGGAAAMGTSKTLQYVFIVGAGAVFFLVLLLSARISTHKHSVLAYENQTHSKVLNP